MFLITIKLDRVSFETKGRQNLKKTADFVIESIVFCPLVPPSWISLVDPTSAMYASAIYVSYIYGLKLQGVLEIGGKTMKIDSSCYLHVIFFILVILSSSLGHFLQNLDLKKDDLLYSDARNA